MRRLRSWVGLENEKCLWRTGECSVYGMPRTRSVKRLRAGARPTRRAHPRACSEDQFRSPTPFLTCPRKEGLGARTKCGQDAWGERQRIIAGAGPSPIRRARASAHASRRRNTRTPLAHREMHHRHPARSVIRHVAGDRLALFRLQRGHQRGLAFELGFEDAEIRRLAGPSGFTSKPNGSPSSRAACPRAAHASSIARSRRTARSA